MSRSRIGLSPEVAPYNPDVNQNQDAPQPVKQHVGSLLQIVKNMEAAGGITPDTARFAQTFAKRHDAGYGSNLDILSTDRAEQIIEDTFEAIDSSASPRQAINFVQRNRENYHLARIVGHGIVGQVENTIYFQDKLRLSRAKSLGMASILSAHHPGFPITMVSDFAGKAIPQELRSSLFIDNNGENPELIRHQLTRFGAEQLGIPFQDGLRAAVFGYALDRITAASPPDAITLVNNRPKVVGGEVIQKKYGLVAGDLRNRKEVKDPSLEALYGITVLRLEEELKAAVHAVRLADDPSMFEYFDKLGKLNLYATYMNQNKALVQLVKNGFTGHFSKMPQEYDDLLQKVKETNDPHLLYALATYDYIRQN